MKHTSIINRIKYFLRLIGIPCDYQLKQIFIKVIGSKKPCPMGHKKGDMFEFNLGNKEEICPVSFESLYPIIYSLNIRKLNKPISNVEDKEPICINCPSHTVSIKYNILC